MPSIHLFVDTNVLLSFFAYTKDDIEQLSKLSDLLKTQKLVLYVPIQVKEEFARNRETKLSESIEKFSAKKIEGIPRFLIGSDEEKAFSTCLDAFNKAHNELIQKAKKDASSTALAVDKLVKALFDGAGVGDVTPEMIEAARLRRDVGNPPGKGKSLGDQINWEYLLTKVPDGETLHVVSKDGDYQSAFKNGTPHQFLTDEWAAKKSGSLKLHQELKPFLNAHFDSINLEIDAEKAKVIDDLVTSPSFSVTHWAISKIEPFFDALTSEDAVKLLRGGLDNSQIRWISSDPDVKGFYTRLLDTFEHHLEAGLLDEAHGVFGEETGDIDVDLAAE